MHNFSGKIVVITGAAGGIGKATAKKFAEAGAKITMVDVNQQALEQAAKEIGLKEGEYLLVAADVTKESDVKRYVDETKTKFGRIDIFFNNAGIEGKFGFIKDTDAENLSKVLDVNVKGVYFGLKHVIPVMTEQKSGAIINTASVAGLSGSPGMAPYVTSKHAVIGLTKCAALEVADQGVRVNAICPAPINTRMMRSIEAGASPDAPEAAKEMYAQAVPMKRYGEPHEVANLVLFLASDAASYITGSAYPVDGGMMA
jgi:meso-butanediol dehydrogenase/(S,S)-butanediol dehydrogenase/diacetyl reductase